MRNGLLEFGIQGPDPDTGKGTIMSNLLFYTILSALWVGLAWAPYILDRVFVRGLWGALANYDANARPQSAWAQRAMRAHRVLIESFAAFAPLAILGHLLLPDDGYLGLLAATYFWAMLAHYVIYSIGIPVLRTAAFVVAVASMLATALRLLGVI